MVTQRRGRAAPGGFRFTPALRSPVQGCRPPSDRHQRFTPALTQQTSMMMGGQAARAARLACAPTRKTAAPAFSASDSEISAAPAPSALHRGAGGAKATCSHRERPYEYMFCAARKISRLSPHRDRAYCERASTFFHRAEGALLSLLN